jgi:GWxTD domain-containing protein
MRASRRAGLLRTTRRAFSLMQLRRIAAVSALGSIACQRAAQRAQPVPSPEPTIRGARADSVMPASDSRASYRRAGLLLGSGDLPFVGSVAFLAAAKPDSTLVLIDLSLPDHWLTFTREAERYHAAYDVVIELQRGGVSIKRVVTHEDVRVGSFRETAREEGSVIYQHMTMLPAGEATVAISIRDAGSTRAGTVRRDISIPRLEDGAMTSPIPAFRARPRASRDRFPEMVANPEATTVYGRDSVALFYVESYGAPPANARASIQVRVSGEGGVPVHVDTVPWIEAGDRLRSAIIRVPISRIGFGEFTLSIDPLGGDSSSRGQPRRAPLLVSFGDGLPVSSFDDMVGLLRFFASAERLRALRELSPPDRPKGWTAFLEATDPIASSSENEALRAYFARLADANVRFREDDRMPGWLTDRGMILSALGEPDNVVEPNATDANDRPRVQVWDYQRYHTRFTFVDRAGFGRWRLTASSEADYHALMRRIER